MALAETTRPEAIMNRADFMKGAICNQWEELVLSFEG
jgi:hypothetical protein